MAFRGSFGAGILDLLTGFKDGQEPFPTIYFAAILDLQKVGKEQSESGSTPSPGFLVSILHECDRNTVVTAVWKGRTPQHCGEQEARDTAVLATGTWPPAAATCPGSVQRAGREQRVSRVWGRGSERCPGVTWAPPCLVAHPSPVQVKVQSPALLWVPVGRAQWPDREKDNGCGALTVYKLLNK